MQNQHYQVVESTAGQRIRRILSQNEVNQTNSDNQNNKYAKGRLDLILGCMFSGKTTTLLHYINECELLHYKYLVINHSSNNRYNNANFITSHDRHKRKAKSCTYLFECLASQEYYDAHIIFIDEGQFFADIVQFVKQAVDNDKKNLIIAALDGTYERKPFPNIANIIPLCDNLVKLKAICELCKNEEDAMFSKRITNSKQTIQIGGNETYMCVCRWHYLN